MPTLETTDTELDTRIYEICVLYAATLSQKEESELIKELEKTIEETGAKQIGKDVWGKHGLAYKIKGHIEGVYIVYHYEMDPTKLKELDVAIRIMPNLLRHMIVKPPKGYEIIKYSEKYQTWLNERESVEEQRMNKKQEDLERKVAEKAKRQADRAQSKKDEVTEKPKEADKEKISEQLDKIISDEDLEF